MALNKGRTDPRGIAHRRMRRGRCHYCKAPASTMDHVWPKSRGGPNALWNLVPACMPCNQKKAANEPTCECRKCRRAVIRAVFSGLA